MPKKQVYYKWSPSLGGGFAGTPEEVWGVKKYDPNQHKNEPCVFCGLYGLPDFYNLWRHKGKKYVWWAGSDIRNFIKGYWLEDGGNIFLNPDSLAEWINKYCESWVENKIEQDALMYAGIKSKVCPSFLGDVKKFEVPFTYKIRMYPHYYSSVSGNDFKLYGWDKINKLAIKCPHWTIHLYGNTIPWKAPKNVFVRGRVSQEEMDKEIKYMTGCIRLIPFEGFSEIVAKAILWGQEVISEIPYNYTRNSLLKVINKYPWNLK
mgnify:CR=1 FL=1